MKASEVIKELAELIGERGDFEVQISLLSECGDIDLDITSITTPYSSKDKAFLIECDADAKVFKNKLKVLWEGDSDKKLKPIYDGCGESDYSDFSHEHNDIWLCPICEEPLTEGKDCKECNQKIDWKLNR